MTQATVKTIQYVDPRIEPQPDPVYDYVIGPTQNQYYRIGASGLSDYTINFNNLTTLGIDRAYLDTFEIEVTAEFHFRAENADADDPEYVTSRTILDPRTFVFDSFPFNKCCEEARVNINGGAFFSQPMCYVRAKERYMNEAQLSKSYQNCCPVHKPQLQYESGRLFSNPNFAQNDGPDNACYTSAATVSQLAESTAGGDIEKFATPGTATAPQVADVVNKILDSIKAQNTYQKVPSRYPISQRGFMRSAEGIVGGTNNSIIRLGAYIAESDAYRSGYENFYVIKTPRNQQEAVNDIFLTVTWREPIFVSPFSSRYDATYGRPLYNITSMDLTFNMCNLGNMIRIANLRAYPPTSDPDQDDDTYPRLKSYDVHIKSANLCYQVMTIPPILNKPLTTLVPYRRFVPYITNLNGDASGVAASEATPGATVTFKSGVYTLNEIPTAIWIFAAPTKNIIQENKEDIATDYDYEDQDTHTQVYVKSTTYHGNYDSNKQFAFLEHINISLANTTQILTTAKPYDLYRIAKANGCEDSYEQWYSSQDTLASSNDAYYFKSYESYNSEYTQGFFPDRSFEGPGSVLRLKPGVDIIVPDQPLIPGANANNMVFQVSEATYKLPHFAPNKNTYALWLLFEYVGVAAISPGQCEITMNPLGSGEIMAVSPIMSATSAQTEGELEGSGFWDSLRRAAAIAGRVSDAGIISRLLKLIPQTSEAGKWAESHGFGEPKGKKRNTCSGGAVIGRGLNDWV